MGSKFAVVFWGGVDEPTDSVTVDVEGEGAGVGATVGVVSGDGGFGELSGGEIYDLYFEVKWCWGLKEFCPGGYCCILEVGVMTREELFERYATGERSFIKIDLSGTQFGGLSITGIDLSGSNLTEVNLSEVALYGANLTGANVTGANLFYCDLTGANLSGANLNGANLQCTNLRCADLREVNFRDARNYKQVADLLAAFFFNTILDDGSIIEGPRFYE